jgi:hypothetical protein
MRKIIAATLAGVTFAATLATAADARPRYRHHRGGDNDEVAAAIIGGVAGLALGAALSSGSNSRGRVYYNGGYSNGYAYDPYYDGYSGSYYAPPPRRYYRERTCVTRDRVYDPYIGRRVVIERRYPC